MREFLEEERAGLCAGVGGHSHIKNSPVAPPCQSLLPVLKKLKKKIKLSKNN